jgi:hypothetical protein
MYLESAHIWILFECSSPEECPHTPPPASQCRVCGRVLSLRHKKSVGAKGKVRWRWSDAVCPQRV